MTGIRHALAAIFVLGTFGAFGVALDAEKELSDQGDRPKTGHPVEVYGKELPSVKDMGVGPTMAARVVGKTLYSIGQGKLHVFGIPDPADPKPLGTLGRLGATRQIEVEDQVASITSREDGVFIVDVSDPERPRHLGTARTGEA